MVGMQAIQVIPGVTLTTDMYETTNHGLARYAPWLVPLSWDRFVAPSSWLAIPDEHGDLSKAEMTLTNTPERTVRLNVWFRPDLRAGRGKPMPHNHPWRSFTGHVLAGGYTEDRYQLGGDGAVRAELGVEHGRRTDNTVDHDVYHEVTAVHEPGETLSLMTCEAGRRGDWGYLDIDTGEHRRLQPVARFDEWFAALNPHLR